MSGGSPTAASGCARLASSPWRESCWSPCGATWSTARFPPTQNSRPRPDKRGEPDPEQPVVALSGVSVSLRRRVPHRNRPLDGTAHQGAFRTVPGRTQYWVSGQMVPARIEGSEGRFCPTPEAPPACWRVKDWLGRGVLAIVAVIMLRRNVPRGSVLLWRLSQGT